jgi:hypothetical protein
VSAGDQPGAALETVRDVLGGDEGGTAGATFMRGLTLGALLGAAIAGSALWRRARATRRTDMHISQSDDRDDGDASSAEDGPSVLKP